MSPIDGKIVGRGQGDDFQRRAASSPRSTRRRGITSRNTAPRPRSSPSSSRRISQRLDLERIAWRARASVEFFRKLVALLEKRHVWSEPIYRYAVLHNDLPRAARMAAASRRFPRAISARGLKHAAAHDRSHRAPRLRAPRIQPARQSARAPARLREPHRERRPARAVPAACSTSSRTSRRSTPWMR